MLISRFGAQERNSKWNQHVRLFQPQRALPPDEPEFFRGMREIQVEQGMGLIALPIDVKRTYPTLAHWIQAHGRFEIGAQKGSGVMVRAFDENGVVFESAEPEGLGEALVALERGIAGVSRRHE